MNRYGESTNFQSDKMMSEVECAYVAGFIDGEGTISVTRQTNKPKYLAGCKYTAYMSVSNTHLGVLEAVRAMVGCGRLRLNKRHKQKEHYKDVWVLHWTPPQMRRLLPQLMRYLIVKVEQGALALKFLKLIEGSNSYSHNTSARQHEMYVKFGELNHRGLYQPVFAFEGTRQVVRKPKPTCSEEGCETEHYAKGYCKRHYRWHHESTDFKDRSDRKCVYCGNDLPDTLRISAKFCGISCKGMYHRRKSGVVNDPHFSGKKLMQ